MRAAAELAVVGVVLLVRRGALAVAVGFRELRLHGLVLRGQEDDLAVGRLGHGLHGLEVSDLHGRGAGQDVGGLAHELGGFHLCGWWVSVGRFENGPAVRYGG